jgi:amino acid transporter
MPATTEELRPRLTEGDAVAAAELDTGHLTDNQLLGLSVASFIPAVGLATVPAFVVAYAGASAWLSMLAAIALFVALGLFISLFARRFVGTGSLYSYVQHVFGDWGKIVMGAGLVPGYIIATMSLIVGFGVYAGSFLSSIGIASAYEFGWQLVLYAFAAVVTTLVVYRGLDVSVRTSVALTIISVPVMALITVATIFGDEFSVSAAFATDGLTLDGFLQGLAIGCAFFVAFESCAALAAETKDPHRAVPRAILVIPIVLGATYLLATLIQVPTLLAAGDELATGASPPAVLADRAGLGFLSEITDLIIAVAVFASFIGIANYASRVLVSVAAEGLLPSGLSQVNQRYKTPTVAIVAIMLPSFLGPVVLQIVSDDTPLTIYGYIATLLVYAWVVPYMVICIGGAMLLMRSQRSSPLVLLGAVVTSAAVLWLYVNGIVNPGPAPLDAMPYVWALTFVVFLVAFIASARARRTSAVPR